MELISPGPLRGAQELKHELFMRAEELERLVAIYKLKLCGEEMASLNYGSMLMDQGNTDVLGDQRGQFYDIYMRKREVKLREEWRARGAEKKAEIRAMMQSLDSTSSTMMSKGKATEPMNDHSRQNNSRKLSSSSSNSSSTSRSSATATNNPAIRSSNSGSLRKENTKASTGISNETTLQKSIARSHSSNDRFSLVKDIKARRSQSLRKNAVSLGEPKDFMHLNYDSDALTPPMNTNAPRNGAPKPLLRKSYGTGPTARLSTAKQRISVASQAPISEENQLEESFEMLEKENEQVDSMRIEDARKLNFSKESWNPAYHRFQSNSHIVESQKSRNSHMQKFLFDVHKASDFDSSVDSLCSDQATRDSHDINQNLEGKTVRVRKKWGSVERPFVAVDTSTHSIMDVTKGIKKFLKFGNRSRGAKISNDKEDNHDSENFSFENLRNSRIHEGTRTYIC
ncbi:hypothetical protein M5K25_012599 [Dendrobium thyrsiflorum]|uniref:Uncharacterized protein n=1 Tax=Dendrobium thyrsiflorum TaxID=117978 RepID=A0ABD0V576_DENTH